VQAGYDLVKWRKASKRISDADLAVLDAHNGAGWSLACQLLRKRHNEDEAVWPGGMLGEGRPSASAALRHRFSLTAPDEYRRYSGLVNVAERELPGTRRQRRRRRRGPSRGQKKKGRGGEKGKGKGGGEAVGGEGGGAGAADGGGAPGAGTGERCDVSGRRAGASWHGQPGEEGGVRAGCGQSSVLRGRLVGPRR